MIRIIVETLVRAVAVLLFVVGCGAAIFVLDQATSLYNEPASIESFAERIEHATGLDRQLSAVLANALGSRQKASTESNADENTDQDAAIAGQDTEPESTVRISYFISWILVILLLSLLIRISLAMVHTGGVLVLHDLRPRQITPDKSQDK